MNATTRAAALIAGLLLLGAIVTGCSKGEITAPDNINTTLPANLGASCTDPPGDISSDASQLGGNLKDPAGIDIVSAKAHLTDTTLQVALDMPSCSTSAATSWTTG